MPRISLEKAIELFGNYILTKCIPNENRQGITESESCWYPIEDLDNLISDAKNLGLEVDGIKIYFGAYSKNQDQNRIKNIEPQKLTTFIVPTISKEGKRLDIFENSPILTSSKLSRDANTNKELIRDLSARSTTLSLIVNDSTLDP